jgi:hypothetical protein
VHSTRCAARCWQPLGVRALEAVLEGGLGWHGRGWCSAAVVALRCGGWGSLVLWGSAAGCRSASGAVWAGRVLVRRLPEEGWGRYRHALDAWQCGAGGGCDSACVCGGAEQVREVIASSIVCPYVSVVVCDVLYLL